LTIKLTQKSNQLLHFSRCSSGGATRNLFLPAPSDQLCRFRAILFFVLPVNIQLSKIRTPRC